MLGRCNFLLDNDQICNRAFNLHGVIFINPETPGTLERIDLCDFHFKTLTDDHTAKIKELQMSLKNTIQENENRRRTAKLLDTYYNDIPMKAKISNIRTVLEITRFQCKNYFCNIDMSKSDQFKKVYTVILLKGSNKVQLTFYFCSLKCLNSFKARCGLTIPILKGQLSL